MAIIGKAIYVGKKNLKNTTWVFNEEIDLIHGPYAEETSTGWSFQVDVNFEVPSVPSPRSCRGIQGFLYFLGGGVPAYGHMSYIGLSLVYDYTETTGGNWLENRTITITDECYDIELYKWLLNNATLQTQ